MERKCRNCGAVIESSDLKICPYCDTEITFEATPNLSGVVSQDTSNISFTLTFGGLDDEAVAVNDVQTIRDYAEKMGEGDVLTIDASSSIYGIEWLSSFKDGGIGVEFCKNNILYMKDGCTFEEFLSFYVDFYEGRFNPSLDEGGFYLLDEGESNSSDEHKTNQVDEGLLAIDNALLERLRDNVYGKKTLIGLCNYLQRGTTIAEYIDLLRKFTSKNSSMAMPDIHSDLFKKVYDRISDKLSADERAICWTDDGIFKHGVSGLMITDKRLFFVSKKSISILPIKDITSIQCDSSLGYPRYINGKAEQKTYYPSEAGHVVLGLICTTARDFNDSGYKIRIY